MDKMEEVYKMEEIDLNGRNSLDTKPSSPLSPTSNYADSKKLEAMFDAQQPATVLDTSNTTASTAKPSFRDQKPREIKHDFKEDFVPDRSEYRFPAFFHRRFVKVVRLLPPTLYNNYTYMYTAVGLVVAAIELLFLLPCVVLNTIHFGLYMPNRKTLGDPEEANVTIFWGTVAECLIALFFTTIYLLSLVSERQSVARFVQLHPWYQLLAASVLSLNFVLSQAIDHGGSRDDLYYAIYNPPIIRFLSWWTLLYSIVEVMLFFFTRQVSNYISDYRAYLFGQKRKLWYEQKKAFYQSVHIALSMFEISVDNFFTEDKEISAPKLQQQPTAPNGAAVTEIQQQPVAQLIAMSSVTVSPPNYTTVLDAPPTQSSVVPPSAINADGTVDAPTAAHNAETSAQPEDGDNQSIKSGSSNSSSNSGSSKSSKSSSASGFISESSDEGPPPEPDSIDEPPPLEVINEETASETAVGEPQPTTVELVDKPVVTQ